MNDKIKQLLENAEQSDAIAKNKWRIENREQLRKERKEKLKELMGKDKQQTAVEQFAIALYENGFLTGNGDEIQELLEKAKAIDKGQRQHTFEQSRLNNKFVGLKYESFEQYYNETYGGGEQ